jgi:hypothetical protein
MKASPFRAGRGSYRFLQESTVLTAGLIVDRFKHVYS